MKNVTEFSGVIIKRATKVRADKFAELKAALQAEAPMESPTEDPTSSEAKLTEETPSSKSVESDIPKNATETEVEPAEEAVEAKPTEEAVEAKPAEEAVEAKPAEETSAKEPVKPKVDEAALATAVAEEMGFDEAKTKYLLGAIKAVGKRSIDQVRKVRVFQGEEGPPGAYSIEDLHFIVDRVVIASKQKQDDKRGGHKGKKGRDKGKGGQFKPAGRPSAGKGGRGFDSSAKDEKTGVVPSGGLGWSLSRAPGDKKEGHGKGRKPGKRGPRRGKPGEKPNHRNRRNPSTPVVTMKAPLQQTPVSAPISPSSATPEVEEKN